MRLKISCKGLYGSVFDRRAGQHELRECPKDFSMENQTEED
jgi:hypothetical protein